MTPAQDRSVTGSSQPPFSPSWREILVVAERNVLSGGLLRFARLQTALAAFGIRTSFAFDHLDGPFHPDNCAVFTMQEAMQRHWDATLLPGAGFTGPFLDALIRFRDDRFGTRVQNVLKDRSREETFVKANRLFQPQSVIFNTQAWTPEHFARFQAERFAIIEGAVDSAFFAPPVRPKQPARDRFVVGMQGKYLSDLKLLAPLLPKEVVFHVIRKDPPAPGKVAPELEALARAGRLRYLGNLSEAELPAFYHACDCILHLERAAGWANLVAEAMACGVPVVCSPPGTLAIAKAGITAKVIDPDDSAAVAAALVDVMADPDAALDQATAARVHICGYSWLAYGAKFLKAAEGAPTRAALGPRPLT